MSAVRKLTAEQRAAHRWHRATTLHLVKLTPVEPEIISPRVQWIVVALVWIGTLIAMGARWAGWLP
jgi:hypothetical protein